MKPGRELDAMVAKKVMGWEPPTSISSCRTWLTPNQGYRELPEFSTDIKAAWEVAAKFPDRFMVERVYGKGEGWVCELALGHGGYWAHGHTAEHAICLAALEASEGEKDY